MSELQIIGDGIYRLEHVPGCDENTVRQVLVMDKETFIEAFKKWILQKGV